MKLIIEGDSINDIHQQLRQAVSDLENTHGKTDKILSEVSEAEIPNHVETHTGFVNNPPHSPDDYDSKGVKYDPAIHSSNREKTTTGLWRKRRGAAEAVQQPAATNVPTFAIPAAPTTMTHVALPIEAPATVEEALTMPQPIPMSQPAPLEPVNPLTQAHSIETFTANIALIISQLITDKKLNQQWVQQCKTVSFGNKEIFEWHTNTTAMTALYDSFISYNFIQKLIV